MNGNNAQYHFHFVHFVPQAQPEQPQQNHFQFFWTGFPFMFFHQQPQSGDYMNNDQMFNQYLAQMFAQHQAQQAQQQNVVKRTKKSALEQLPIYTCNCNDSYQTQFGDSQIDCSICLCESENGDHLLRLPCTHTFHQSCIEPWLQGNHTCPVCRFELPVEVLPPQQENMNLNAIKLLNKQTDELNKQIEQRMMNEYGPDSLRLMQIGNDIQKLYSRIQTLEDADRNDISLLQQQLNSIEVALNQNVDKLDSVIIPIVQSNHHEEDDHEDSMQDDQQEEEELQQQQPKYTWDWSKIRQVRRQLVHRIQALLNRVDQLRLVVEEHQTKPQVSSDAMTD